MHGTLRRFPGACNVALEYESLTLLLSCRTGRYLKMGLSEVSTTSGPRLVVCRIILLNMSSKSTRTARVTFLRRPSAESAESSYPEW